MRQLALDCDPGGTILTVLHDDFDLCSGDRPPAVFPALATERCTGLCFELLEALDLDGAIYDWRIELHVGAKPTVVHFAGMLADDRVTLLGSERFADVERLHSRLSARDAHLRQRLGLLETARLKSSSAEPWLDRITELHNELESARRELLQRANRLASLDDEKNTMLAMAAHDMAGPLWGIEQAATSLAADPHMPAIQATIAGEIAETTTYLQSIAKDFLDIAAIQSGHLNLHPAPVDLDEVVQKALRILRRRAHLKRVRIIVDEHDPVVAAIDADRILQAIGNILGNAIEHSPPDAEVHVRIAANDGQVRVSVSDHGPGIPEEQRSSIFHIFRAGTGSHGHGLGLAVAQRVVEEHNGTIEFECPQDGGTIFTLMLPVGMPQERAADVAPAAPPD